jgi:hypothetical protein
MFRRQSRYVELLAGKQMGKIFRGNVEVPEARARKLTGEPEFQDIDDRLNGLKLTKENRPRYVWAGPMLQKRPRYVITAAIAGFSPAANIFAQSVDQMERVALFLREQVAFGACFGRSLGLVPILRLTSTYLLVRRGVAGRIEPVEGRLLVSRVDDWVGDGLARDEIIWEA